METEAVFTCHSVVRGEPSRLGLGSEPSGCQARLTRSRTGVGSRWITPDESSRSSGCPRNRRRLRARGATPRRVSGVDPISYLNAVATRAKHSPGAMLLPADYGAEHAATS